MVRAQLAVYPLRHELLRPALVAASAAASAAIQGAGLAAETGTTSTIVTGEAGAVFRALEDAFARAASTGRVVITITLSNAVAVA